MTFSGFPKAALDFYDDLELDNTKSFWTAHKETYETAVKAPMLALTAALEEEFGPAKVYVGAGFYEAASDRLARVRAAIADDRTGPELVKILATLQRKGWTLGGEKLKTTPKGYAADHPRIDLLRHKSMTLGKSYGFDEVIHTPKVLTMVRGDWRAARPFVEWISRHG